MQITEITIFPTNDGVVGAYVDIIFDNCFMVEGIKIIKAPKGLFISFPTKKLSDGPHWDVAFPANTETRRMIERAVLAEYEKVVADPLPSEIRKDNSGDR